MKRYLTILLLLNVVAMTASAREVFPINEGWRFFFKSEKTSDNARHVTLPHSWNTDPLAQGYWLETTGSYQNGMYIPVEWASKRLFVKFYGVQSVADLFVNGYHVGTHRGGATAFTFEITDKIRFGSDNSMLVVVSNSSLDRHEPLRRHLPRGGTDPHRAHGHFAALPRVGRRARTPADGRSRKGRGRDRGAHHLEGRQQLHAER